LIYNRVPVYWWKGSNLSISNFGDEVGPYLIQKLFKKRIIPVPHPSMRRFKWILPHFVTAGSIISEINANSIVWGSGIIKKDQEIKMGVFLAVRGYHTRKRLIELGYSCPEKIGDPALLLPLCYNPNFHKKVFKYTFIPHYVDYMHVKETFGTFFNVINLKESNVEDVIDQILKSEYIISSSLHGLIVPHTYGIPALWVNSFNKLAGDNIKFKDYLESVNIFQKNPITIQNTINISELEELFVKNAGYTIVEDSILQRRRDDLLESCPFNKSAIWILMLLLKVIRYRLR